jgi:hypothetical protein
LAMMMITSTARTKTTTKPPVSSPMQKVLS